ncbi:MAG: hypothetical protein ACRDJC_03755, partial [Thermomicrobiales bacterium]
MVAGSPARNPRRFEADGITVAPANATRLLARSRGRFLTRAGDWPALVAFYLLAVAALLLPWPFGAHPDWAYNWEGYTAWRWTT